MVRNLDGVAAMANAPAGMTLTGRGDPVQIPMWIVSGNFFDVLACPPPWAGHSRQRKTFLNSQPAVTISHALWRDRFGADPSIVGQTLTLDGRSFIVSGVAPRGFAYPPQAQMWVTIAHGVPEYVENRSVGWLEIIGRMKEGVTPAAARADLAIPLDELTKRYHAARGREDVSVVPLQRELLGDTRPHCGPCLLQCWCCLPWPAPTSVVFSSYGVRRGRTTLLFVWHSARTAVMSSARRWQSRPC